MAYPEYNSCIAIFSASPKDFVCYICPEKIGTSLVEHKNDKIHSLKLQYFYHHFNDAGRLIQCKTCGIFLPLEDLIKHAQSQKIIPWFRPAQEFEILFKNIISCSNEQYYCHVCDIKLPFWFLAISHTQGADHKNCLSVKIGESYSIDNLSFSGLAKLCVENFIFINKSKVFFCFICKDEIETSGNRIIEHTSKQKHKKKQAKFKNYLKSAKRYKLSFDKSQNIDPVYNHNDQFDIIISICKICGMQVARNAIDSHLELHEKNISTSKNGRMENKAHSHTMPGNVDSVGASCSTWKIDENKEVITISNSIGNELDKSIIEDSNNVLQTDKSIMKKHAESVQLRDGTTHNVKPESIDSLNESVSASTSSLKAAGSPDFEASSSKCQSDELSSECASDRTRETRTTKKELIRASPTTPISKAEPIDLSNIQEIAFTKCETCDEQILCDPGNILRHTTSSEHVEKLKSQALTIYGKNVLIEPIFTQSHDKFFITKPKIESFGDLMEILMVPSSNNGKFPEIFYWCNICESKLHDIPDNHVKSEKHVHILHGIESASGSDYYICKTCNDNRIFSRGSVVNHIRGLYHQKKFLQNHQPAQGRVMKAQEYKNEEKMLNGTNMNFEVIKSHLPKKYLPEAIEIISGERFFLCTVCNCRINGSSNKYKRHVYTIEHIRAVEKNFILKIKEKLFACLACFKCFYNHELLETHLSDFTHQYKCNTMKGKNLAQVVDELLKPIKIVETNKYDCSICNSPFFGHLLGSLEHTLGQNHQSNLLHRMSSAALSVELKSSFSNGQPPKDVLQKDSGSLEKKSMLPKSSIKNMEINQNLPEGIKTTKIRTNFCCKICQCLITGLKSVQEHVRGGNHRNLLAAKRAEKAEESFPLNYKPLRDLPQKESAYLDKKLTSWKNFIANMNICQNLPEGIITTTKESIFYCNICQCTINGFKNIEEHVAGGKHKNQLVAKKTANSDKSSLPNAISPQDIPPKESASLERKLTSLENSTENIDILENLPEGIITAENQSIFYCNICHSAFGDSEDMKQHVVGRKHKNKLIEKEAPGSEKSSLLNCKQPIDVLQGASVSVNRKSTSTNNSTHNMDICQTLSECITTTKTEKYVNELMIDIDQSVAELSEPVLSASSLSITESLSPNKRVAIIKKNVNDDDKKLNSSMCLPEGIEAFGKRRLCTICNCWILNKQSTNDHIATIDHEINGPKVISRIKGYSFQCEVCQCDIPDIQTLKQHLGSIDHQSKKNEKYPVDKAIKRQRLYALPKHMIRVANDSRFLCKICRRMITGTSTHAARHVESKSHTRNLEEFEKKQRDRITVSKLSSQEEITTTLSSNTIKSNIDFNVEKYGLARVYIGSRGSTKNLPEGIERFSARNCLYCTICCCKIQGSMSIDDHIATINHKTKGPKVINSIGNGVLQCQLCDCKIQGLPYLQEHLASSKHLSNKTGQSRIQDFAKNNMYDLPEGIMRIDDRNGFLCEICSHMIPPTLKDALEHVKEKEHRSKLRQWQALNVFLNEKEGESVIRPAEQIIISVGNNQSSQIMPFEQKVPIDFNDMERSYADITRGLRDVHIQESQDSPVHENSVEHINSQEEATEAIDRVPKTSMITTQPFTNCTRTKSRKLKTKFKCPSCHIKFLNYGELHTHMTEHFLPRFDANSTEEGRQLAEIPMKDLSNQLNSEEDESEDSEDNDSIEEITNIKVNHGVWNRQLDIDRGNGLNIYEVHYKKKEYLGMGILLTFPMGEEKFYCLVCQETMKNTVQFFYEHLCSLHHLDSLQEMLDDHSFFENRPRELSDLALAYEYIEEFTEKLVECHACRTVLPNKNILLHEHIKSDEHVDRWKVFAANCKAWASAISSLLKYDFYMVRKYWCVLCNCRYTSECEFQDHMYTKKHKKAIAKFSDMGQMLIYDYCAVCATLWFGFIRTYSYHITGAMHKYHIDKDFYLVRQLPTSAEELLCSPNDQINTLLMEIDKAQGKNKRKEELLIRDLESIAKEKYPNCVVHTFGSRTTKLGGRTSDLDIFLDCSTKKYPVYEGQNSSLEKVQERLKAIKSCLLKHPQVWVINQDISNARTPIIKAVHLPTGIDCDLSFTNGLAVEGTKLVKAYCENFPNCRRLIIFIKKWMAHCNLDGSSGIHSCAIGWMVIFFLQRKAILPTVAELIAKKNQSRLIGGWEVGVDFDFDVIDTREPIERLLVQFFRFYANFDYRNQIICPLLGEPVDKKMMKQKQRIPSEMKQYRCYLQSNKIAEPFRLDSILCIQDPFDLSHNITKATKKRLVYRLKTFCELSAEFLDNVIVKFLIPTGRMRSDNFSITKNCHPQTQLSDDVRSLYEALGKW